MSNINQIKEKIQKALSDKNPKNALNIIKNNALKAKLIEVEKVRKILEIEKYRLIFIGSIGSGKTTAICHIFNLLGDFPKGKNNRIATSELMVTGAGGVTICEVVIRSTDQPHSLFEVEFIKRSELEKLAEDFCDLIASQFSDDSIEKNANINAETLRAMRNLLDLKRKESEDEAEVFFVNKCKRDIKRFKQEIKDRINKIPNCEKSVLIFNKGENLLSDSEIDKEEKKWLKNTFTKINFCSLEGFSVPKRITIYVSSRISGSNSLLTQFHSVVDTRGLDGNLNQVDLDSYIRMEDTICLFTSQFKSAPNPDIVQLIRYYIDKESFNYQRFISIIITRNGEPESVIGDDGVQLDDYNDGIQLKKRMVRNGFIGQQITLLEERNNSNILFYNALHHYSDGLPEKNEEQEIENERQEIIQQINNIIAYRKSQTTEIQKLDFEVDKIVAGENNQSYEKNITQLILSIQSYANILVSNEFNKDFIKQYNSYFRNELTRHAIHRHEGIWEFRNIDISLIGQNIADEIIKLCTIEYRNNILGLILSVNHLELTLISNEMLQLFESQFKKFTNMICQNVYNRLHNVNFNNTSFWDELISFMGSEDYNEKVNNAFEKQLADVNIFLKKEIEEKWKELMIKPLLSFLGIEYFMPDYKI